MRFEDYGSITLETNNNTASQTSRNPPNRFPDTAQWPEFTFMGLETADMDDLDNILEIIRALDSHRINTLQELRRIERVFAAIGTPTVTGPMTSAWSYYVNSNMLLTELRQLTSNYPFSSHCIDEAKRRVYADPSSNRSWNFCWLVLTKIRSDQLIQYYAVYQAASPEMWGGHTPTKEQIQALATAFTREWDYAVNEMLRHWEDPPVGEDDE